MTKTLYKNIILLLIIHLLLSTSSCCESSTLTVTMTDGNTLNIPNEITVYYTQEDFEKDISFGFIRNYYPSEISYIDYLEGVHTSITGVDDTFCGTWKLARFGNWISEFGLVPNKTYYVATKTYAKYVNTPPDGLSIMPRKYTDTNMGYIPQSTQRTFQFYHINHDFSVLLTGIPIIGYNSDREPLNLILTNLTKPLLWNFTIVENGWD